MSTPAENVWRFDYGDGFFTADFAVDGAKVTVIPSGGFPEGSYTFELPVAEFGAAGGKASAASITTPMPGRVVKVVSTPGADVEAGATLMIVEAMKMEVRWRLSCVCF